MGAIGKSCYRLKFKDTGIVENRPRVGVARRLGKRQYYLQQQEFLTAQPPKQLRATKIPEANFGLRSRFSNTR
jgi:hypothetical protein